MKKVYLIILFVLLITHYSRAQFNIEAFKTPAQQMVENVVKPVLFVVHSSYQLQNKETGILYGLNGQQVFGEKKSYGIKTNEGVILEDFIVCPWNYDERFPTYKDKYTPVLNEIKFSEFEKKAKYDSLIILKERVVSLSDSSFYLCESNTFEGKGLLIDKNIGEKSGWLVWLTVPKDDKMEINSNVSFVIQQKKIEISKEKYIIDFISPKTDNIILGGLYVTPTYEEMGSIKFLLTGILKEKNSNWFLYCPFYNLIDVNNGENKRENSKTIKQNVENKDELTPVPSNSKKSKKDKKKK